MHQRQEGMQPEGGCIFTDGHARVATQSSYIAAFLFMC